MKNYKTLLLALVFLCLALNSHAQQNRTLSNGFSIQAIIGIPAADYGWVKDHPVRTEYQYKSLFGLQLGNRWYFGDLQPFGVGLMVNWLEVTAAVSSFDILGVRNYLITVETAIIEFGPVGTYAINDAMAVDVYYNLRPSGMVTIAIDEDGDNSEDFMGSSFSHAFGAAYRYKALYAGIEYVFGKAKHIDAGDPDLSVNNFRFVIGAKF